MFEAVYLYRIAHFLYRLKIPFLPKIFFWLNFFLYNCSIPYQSKLGKGTYLSHSGIGVVINSRCIIGDNVEIGANVTIGSKVKHGPAPKIGNKVYIATGAKILGDITVGSNVIIGANSVVLDNIPDNSVVVGMPGKVIKKLNDGEILKYFGE